MKIFYLFCNTGYGGTFLDEFRKLAESDENSKFNIVFSSSKANTIREYLNRLIKIFKRTGHCTIIYCENVNDKRFIATVPQGSIGVVAGFNQIFRAPIIAKFQYFINFHPSILPFYRGAIPSYWVLRNGEKRTGFTAHQMTSRIDDGPIIYQDYVDIPENIQEAELDGLIATAAAPYFKHMLINLRLGLQPFQATKPGPYATPAEYMPAERAKQ